MATSAPLQVARPTVAAGTAFFIKASRGGLVVKASASQLGGRRFESRTDEAGWLATS